MDKVWKESAVFHEIKTGHMQKTGNWYNIRLFYSQIEAFRIVE